jgi:murein DD-endopeptidase MepM/ murein hydrolase activator NlpD
MIRMPFEQSEVVCYLRRPHGVSKPAVVFAWAGIDTWKEEMTTRVDHYLQAGLAVLTTGIPQFTANALSYSRSPLFAFKMCLLAAALVFTATLRRRIAAIDDGRFENEIVPVEGVTADESIRPDTTLEGLQKLPPVFDTTSGKGSVTAGNSSQLSDGASATVLVSRHAQLIEDAQVAGDAYRSVLGRVAKGYERAKAIHDQARAAVGRLEAGLEEAQALEARLVRLERRRQAAAKVTPTPPPGGGGGGGGGGSGGSGGGSGSACILERPYSYVDSWGAARSGGRSHQGTDVMAPHGARVFAFVNGVVSRESSSTNGGIQLYLQGDNGVEYFYAHLSGYAVGTGTRVRAGQLVAYNGQTGNARYTAPHVHFEVHLSGGPVNPYPYLKRACG